jgi:protein-disulfide isomerase
VELDAPTRGDEDAPVVMVEYADFQCPFCGKFARDIEPELVKEYVESGTLRMEWRDFPYLGQESVNAALAARAAQEQGKFWEYHDLLYQNQGSLNSKAFSDEKLTAFAEEVGLDAERLESDFTSGKYEQVVSRDFMEGQSKGVRGTPTFYINGKVLVGAQPVETFEKAIEEAAREAGDG